MDRMLYIAMNGAKQNMLAQSANTNNLANVSTPGFRADFASFRSMPVFGGGFLFGAFYYHFRLFSEELLIIFITKFYI